MLAFGGTGIKKRIGGVSWKGGSHGAIHHRAIAIVEVNHKSVFLRLSLPVFFSVPQVDARMLLVPPGDGMTRNLLFKATSLYQLMSKLTWNVCMLNKDYRSSTCCLQYDIQENLRSMVQKSYNLKRNQWTL